MRVAVALLVAVSGVALAVVSYFLLAAPLGSPVSVRFSNPRLQFAPSLFIAGVMLVFVSAVVYELLPDRRKQ
jgi:hypothetical protein